jgi:hypothetical protein
MGAPVTAWIDSVGIIGPGLADWAAARDVLRGERPWRQAPAAVTLPAILPPAERRRTSLAVRIALAAGHQALEASSYTGQELASVFASSGGDGSTCHLICEALALDDRRVSPTQFHNSVHNAPAGYWGIAMRATRASTSLCGYDASFAAGLIEAMSQVTTDGCPVILVAYDAPYPEPLHACRPVADAFGVAFVLAPGPTAGTRLRLSMALVAGEPDRMTDPALETLRGAIPTAQALPLLRAIAGGKPDVVVLPYLDPVDHGLPPTRLRLEIGP